MRNKARGDSLSPIEKIVAKELSEWDSLSGTHSKGDPGKNDAKLLRLALLRETYRKLHAELSRFLANGLRDQVPQIEQWETYLDKIRDSMDLELSLSDLIQNFSLGISFQQNKTAKPQPLPPKFLSALEENDISRNKILRPDRVWEKAITAEALIQNWTLWAMEARIQIEKIEEWDQTLMRSLWPKGILLFAESCNPPASDPLFWSGRWMIFLNSKQTAEPKILNLNQAGLAQSLPSWHLLY